MTRILDLTIPDVGDTDSIELIEWHLAEGESFQAGDIICDLVTDKAAFSLEAPADGSLREILLRPPAGVDVGQIVGRIEIQTEASIFQD